MHGVERLRSEPAPFVIVCNHAALLDSVFIICAARRTFSVCGARPIYFSTLARRLLLRLLRVIRVDDDAGFERDCAAILARPEPILVYPEMGRNPEAMGPFKENAARVVLANGVPVLPCYIRGTTVGQDPKAVRLLVGTAFTPDPGLSPADLTVTLRTQIQALADGAAA